MGLQLKHSRAVEEPTGQSPLAAGVKHADDRPPTETADCHQRARIGRQSLDSTGRGRASMALRRSTQHEIRALEERLANPGPDADRYELSTMFAPEFREFGSGGRVFDSTTVLEAIGRGGVAELHLEGFRVERVATNVMLATYIARTAAGPGWRPPSLRSSLWCRRESRWQIVFHQGTRLPTDGQPT